MKLVDKKCKPCEGGVSPMNLGKVTDYMKELKDWVLEGGHIVKRFRFDDFKRALEFVNKVGGLAESEKHHPLIILEYGSVKVELWTHAINGLSENDFILAAKIDAI
jgi:4a-hydroxytetrahydrobiopterin dehydratase